MSAWLFQIESTFSEFKSSKVWESMGGAPLTIRMKIQHKEMKPNINRSIRPNPELLDFTDQMGILVMDENRNFANESQYYYDAGLMVKRDISFPTSFFIIFHLLILMFIFVLLSFHDIKHRNHPSIIMWSLCNENGCMEGEPAGAVVAANFKSVIKNLDPFRPVVAAMNGLWGEGLSWVLDILS